jgi:hypothetical protein
VVSKDRRVPRFGRFIMTGAVLGFVAGSAVAVFGPATPSYTPSTAVGFIGLLGAFLGVLVSALVAVGLDRSGSPPRQPPS